jgi:hypothetical protein
MRAFLRFSNDNLDGPKLSKTMGAGQKHLLDKDDGSLAAFFGKFGSDYRRKHPEVDWDSLKWIPNWKAHKHPR